MQYFNRYTRRLEEEVIPKEGFIKWLYYTPMGRCFLKNCMCKGVMSKWMGIWMNTRWSRRYILPFVKRYGIDLNDFEKTLGEFSHFNDFFCRKFKPEKRLFDADDGVVCSPAEGRHLGFNSLAELPQFFVKGESMDLAGLLGSREMADKFSRASVVISRLSPVDYHRFHFPLSGVPSASQLINGYLFSVHPLALKKNIAIFLKNKRWVSVLNNPSLGEICMVEVGATGIGSTVQTYVPNEFVHKGQEKGYFCFGGSTVITLFASDKIQLAADLLKQTKRGYELYVHCGDAIARVC